MIEFLSLKKSNCKNCYKCIRHCPVKSIRFSANQAHIVGDECILCGNCFVVCPQDAKIIIDETETAKVIITENKTVIASVAPSFAACFPEVGIKSLEKGLQKLGFSAAEETAIGATLVKTQYENILKEGDQKVLISSCCPSVNLLIQKHYPKCLKYLANVKSPMQAHAIEIKKKDPNAKIIFIGPCLSKKDEAARYPGYVDCVLTFEDLIKWFEKENISLEKEKDSTENSRARFFPTNNGIIKTMKLQDDYSYLAIDGVENCIKALKDIEDSNLDHCFIEMSSCVGSCVGGPVMQKYRNYPIKAYQEVSDYAGKEDFKVTPLEFEEISLSRDYIQINKRIPNEDEIKEILAKIGKTTKEDELNCGSCGYNTCREKAIAVFQGKADLTMCLPYLKDKAESFTDNIVNNTPNAIIVVNEELEVQLMNSAAREILNVKSNADVLGDQVVRVLDPRPFMDVLDSNKNLRNSRSFLAEYDKYVEQSIVYDRTYHILICILRDITEEQLEKEKREGLQSKTVEIADNVVEKQMRVVQEIASLLGETVAETKIALTNLKESITNE